MLLTKTEAESLDGKNGDALASAYRILVAIGEATDAEKLVPITWAHVSGVNYNTIGDSGLKFLEKFSTDARTAVRTTINPMGFDRNKPGHIPVAFRHKQAGIVAAYEKMGILPSFTCTPYEVFDIPKKGSAVSFAESNAAVFSNSMMGLKTNKESALSALASAVTGKAPLSDLRARGAETPGTAINADFDFKSELDFGLLGYFAGKVVKDSSVSLGGIHRPSTVEAKALSGGLGTSGSCGMFTIGDDADEKISFGKKEAQAIKDELNTGEDGEIITLGSPQFGLGELELLSKLVQGKKFTRRCMIFCSRAIHNQATKIGLTGLLEKSGAEFMCDSCTCLTPYITKEEHDSVVANSVKAAYYLNNSNKVKVALKDIKTIAKDYAR
jgi:predicted aconitase